MSTLNNNVEVRSCSPVKEEDVIPWLPQESRKMPTGTNNNNNKGGYDYELEVMASENKNRYECPICLLCLRDPMLTSCGHRFCGSCIQTWFQKEGRRCPLDGVILENSDIFPDQCTRREILQSKVKCPYSTRGCSTLLPINGMEIHVRNCSYRPRSFGTLSQTSSSSGSNGLCLVDCYYREVGCTARLPTADLQQHLDAGMPHHLQLLTTAYNQLNAVLNRRDSQGNSPLSVSFEGNPTSPIEDFNFRRQRSWDCARFAQKMSTRGGMVFRRHESQGSLNVANRLELEGKEYFDVKDEPIELKTVSAVPITSPSTSHRSSVSDGTTATNGNGNDPKTMDRLLTDLYQRLVQLEQKNTQQEIVIQRLNQQMAASCSVSSQSCFESVSERCCQGEYLWRLKNFSNVCQQMKKNPYQVSYSPSFYSHPFGYKTCGRLNLNQLEVSLFLHFMEGQWDNSITWPFQGTVTLQMIHPHDNALNMTESLHSRDDAAAFHRPIQSRNPKGYGFAHFCPLDRILDGGFLGNDNTLLIRLIVVPINRLSNSSTSMDNGDSCTTVDMYSTIDSKADG